MIWSVLFLSLYRTVISVSIKTNLRVVPSTNDVNTKLVSRTFESDTAIRCAGLCLDTGEATFHYDKGNNTCYCYTGWNVSSVPKQDTGLSMTPVPALNADNIFGYPTFSKTKKEDGSSSLHAYPEPADCLELYERGFLEDGVYVIHPVGGAITEAWCDQGNIGWTIIQRREDGSENFNRKWKDYLDGFGNKSGEYWLGLENIRLLTAESSSLQIRMRTFGDVEPKNATALYGEFKLLLGPEDKYRLFIDDYSGSCGDSLTYHNGSQFSTSDSDNDYNCALTSKAGWWYDRCYASNLNGIYWNHGPISFPDESGISWYECWTHQYSIKCMVMEVRRN